MRKTTGSNRTRLALAGAAATVCAGGAAIVAFTPADASEPVTAAAVHAAAERIMTDFTTGRFTDAWQMLTPDAQHTVTEATWVAVYSGCGHVPLAYTIGPAALSGTAAEVRVTVSSYPILVDFRYVAGHWRYKPALLTMFDAGSIQADIAAARTFGICP